VKLRSLKNEPLGYSARMPKRVVLALSVALASLVASAPAASASRAYFRSPSGNILCTVVGYQQVGCAVVSRRQAANVSRYGSARQVGYAPANHARFTLYYGERYRFQGFLCFSSTSGMRCSSTATGRGFKVSKANILLF